MKSSVIIAALLLQQVMGQAGQGFPPPNVAVAKASNEFANNLYQKISNQPGNVLICPISLHVALALVYQGASGDTATQLAGVLKLGPNQSVKEGYKSVLNGIQDTTLKIATKLFPAAGYNLNKDYTNIARNYFQSDVENVDYSKPAEAARKINKYVEEKTNDKIHDLISPDAISDLTRLIIINAVHFQAFWKKTFPSAYDDFFKVTPENKVRTKMMSQTDYFQYKEDPVLQAKVLKMDYEVDGYSMVFILPNEETGLRALEYKLATTSLEAVLKDLKETRVEVTIPKFTLEQTHNLKDVLANMGLTEVFSSRADLHNIATGDNLYVSDVIQKTFINVHENGTEAAAATAFLETLSAPSSDQKVFLARWPFHYILIRSKNPLLVLFDGRFVEPQESPLPEKDIPQQGNMEEAITFEGQEKDKNKILPNSPQPSNINSQVPQQENPDEANRFAFGEPLKPEKFQPNRQPQPPREQIFQSQPPRQQNFQTQDEQYRPWVQQQIPPQVQHFPPQKPSQPFDTQISNNYQTKYNNNYNPSSEQPPQQFQQENQQKLLNQPPTQPNYQGFSSQQQVLLLLQQLQQPQEQQHKLQQPQGQQQQLQLPQGQQQQLQQPQWQQQLQQPQGQQQLQQAQGYYYQLQSPQGLTAFIDQRPNKQQPGQNQWADNYDEKIYFIWFNYGQQPPQQLQQYNQLRNQRNQPLT